MLAALTTGLQQLLLGLGILALAFALRRTARRGRSGSGNSTREVAERIRQRESSELQAARRAEIRLHEVAREYEARLATQAAFLEQLIRDADDRIARLETLASGRSPVGSLPDVRLAGSSSGAATEQDRPEETLNAELPSRSAAASERVRQPTDVAQAAAVRAFVVNMSLAGFTKEEIAHCAGLPVEQVESVLHEARRPDGQSGQRQPRAA